MNEAVLSNFRFLSAKILALQACVHAMAATHPDPASFVAVLDVLEEGGMSNMLQLPWDDATLEAYRETVASVRKRAQRP